MKYTAAVITVSDKGYRGEREDTSGPSLCHILEEHGYAVVRRELVPDEKDFSAVLRKIICDGIFFVAGDNGTFINFHKLITAVSFYNRRPAPPLASIYHKFPAVKSRKAGKFCFR